MENPLLKPFATGSRLAEAESASKPAPLFFYTALFVLVGLLASFSVSYTLVLFLNELSLKAGILFASTIVVFAVVLLFQSLMVQSRGIRFGLYVAEGLALLSFIMLPFSLWLLVAAALFAVYCMYGSVRADQYLEDSDRITFFRYSGRFLGGFFTGMTLFAALLIVGLYVRAGGITENAFEVLLRGVERPLSFSLGTPVTGSLPLSEVATRVVEQKLAEQPGFAELPIATQRAAVREAVGVAVTTIGEQLATPVERGETIGSYGYRLLMKAIAHAQALNLGPLILLALLFLAFIFSKSFVWLLRIPAMLIGQIIYVVLRSLGIIAIRVENRPKDVFVVR